MKYQANPVIVDAFIIIDVDRILGNGSIAVKTQDGQSRTATKEMISRFIPSKGDYWVVQSDGYEYVNPKDVFKRKYSPVLEAA